MNWTKLSIATTLAAALIATPATAYADCGDAGQDPCAGPVPTVDQVLDLLGGLTDADVPAASKTGIVTPGFSPEEAGTIDDRLHHMAAMGRLPYNWIVTNIQSAPGNFAGATVATVGSPRVHSADKPIVLVDQGGHWMITHDTAVDELDLLWRVDHRYIPVPGFAK